MNWQEEAVSRDGAAVDTILLNVSLLGVESVCASPNLRKASVGAPGRPSSAIFEQWT